MRSRDLVALKIIKIEPGNVCTTVHTCMYVYVYIHTYINVELESLPASVCQVRLDWLSLYCLDLTQPAELLQSVAQLVEYLPRKQYVMGLNPT